jgi:hypothetical protein
MPVPDSRLLGGSPRIDCGSIGNANSAVSGEKNPVQAFFCENPTPKHPLIQVFARSIPSTDGENNSAINSGITAERTAE